MGFTSKCSHYRRRNRPAIAASPQMDKLLASDLGIKTPETTDRVRTWPFPVRLLNLRGINSGNVGVKARNVIPPSASASIGIRLVPAQDTGLFAGCNRRTY